MSVWTLPAELYTVMSSVPYLSLSQTPVNIPYLLQIIQSRHTPHFTTTWPHHALVTPLGLHRRLRESTFSHSHETVQGLLAGRSLLLEWFPSWTALDPAWSVWLFICSSEDLPFFQGLGLERISRFSFITRGLPLKPKISTFKASYPHSSDFPPPNSSTLKATPALAALSWTSGNWTFISPWLVNWKPLLTYCNRQL